METNKKTFRFRYAMEIFIDAEDETTARKIFENADLSNGDFVELEDAEEY